MSTQTYRQEGQVRMHLVVFVLGATETRNREVALKTAINDHQHTSDSIKLEYTVTQQITLIQIITV